MTVQYSLTAATASFKKFMCLLRRWKGSVWKLIIKEMVIWSLVTIALLCLYIFSIKGTPFGEYYEACVKQILDNMKIEEMVIVLLGFSSSICISRWMDQYRLLVWPDNIVMLFNTLFDDDAVPTKAQAIRSTVARYLMLSYILLIRDVSPKVRKLYDNFDELIEFGIVTEDDLQKLAQYELPDAMCKYFVPLFWIVMHLKKHYKSNPRNSELSTSATTVMEEQCYAQFVSEIGRMRGMLGDILAFDWVPIPLALVHLLTMTYYAALVHNTFCVQPLVFEVNREDNFPYFAVTFAFLWTLSRNIVYLGWVKMIQVVVNPFGEDDDDFEVTWLLERHFDVIQSVLEEPEKDPPAAVKMPKRPLPHTLASAVSAVVTNPASIIEVAAMRLRQRRQHAV